MMNSSGGKGSSTRPPSVSKETYSSNWDKIFANKNASTESKPNSVEQKKSSDKQSTD